MPRGISVVPTVGAGLIPRGRLPAGLVALAGAPTLPEHCPVRIHQVWALCPALTPAPRLTPSQWPGWGRGLSEGTHAPESKRPEEGCAVFEVSPPWPPPESGLFPRLAAPRPRPSPQPPLSTQGDLPGANCRKQGTRAPHRAGARGLPVLLKASELQTGAVQ